MHHFGFARLTDSKHAQVAIEKEYMGFFSYQLSKIIPECMLYQHQLFCLSVVLKVQIFAICFLISIFKGLEQFM